MSLDEATLQDRQLAQLLAAYDDALATGTPLPEAGAPADLHDRVVDNLDCLRLLHHLRPDPAPPTTTAAPGDRYALVRRHAAGGIGQIWIAQDRDLGRDVALKELRGERARNPAILARFLREARITGRLQHPGIVPVYELAPGRRLEDPPYYTMRFVQGRTLSEAARSYHRRRILESTGPVEQAGLLNAFVSVCNTVAYAHSRGVIHRDLKGENIVLGDFGEVMVLDWGFAKLIGESEEMATDVEKDIPASPGDTQAGQVLGTPCFMAPEQAAGQSELVGFRTDVYGLGAILYELLTGRPPFIGEDTEEILSRVRQESPARPETVASGVPPALAAVCWRALARDPAQRYASAAELGREVQHWLADEPVESYREPPLARLSRWARRNRPVVTAVAALLITGLAAMGIGTVLLEQQRAETAAVKVRGESERATAEARARRAAEDQLYLHRIALAERELAVRNLNSASQLLDACPPNLRAWEWHHLKQLCHADPMTLRGHTAAVAAIAFHPDGRYLASAGHDRSVRIWDLTTGRETACFLGHDDVVYGVAFSPDGDHLATASWDRTVKIWDMNGREVFTLRGHEEPVWRVAYSPDGAHLVSLSIQAVKVWDSSTGKEVRTLGTEPGLPNRYGLAFAADGRTVAVTNQDATVVLWELATGEARQVFKGHKSAVKNVTFSLDGRLAASGAGDLVRNEPGEVRVWDPVTGNEVFLLRGHTESIYGVAFSPDGKRLASASQDHTVKLWDPATGREVLTIRAHSDTVRAVAFSPDGWRLATACVDGLIKIWDATPRWNSPPPANTVTLAGHGAPVFGIAYYPDGRRLAALSDNETIRTWDTEARVELMAQRGSVVPQIYSLALNADGSLLATATTDGGVWLIDPETFSAVHRLHGHGNGPVKSLAFSRDGSRLALAHWDRVIWLWDVKTGQSLRTLTGHEDAVIGVAFAPDGRQIASASYDRTVRIWDVDNGRPIHVLSGHTSRVSSVAYSPDGRVLASSSNDGTIRLWDANTGKPLRAPLTGHASGVNGIAFSADGRRLASAGNDWTVKVWDVSAGSELHTFRGHTDRVHAVAFRPDGRRLASASADTTVRVWDLSRVNSR